MAKIPNDQLKTLRGRAIYVSARIPEIKIEAAALQDERKSVIAKAKVSSGDQLKQLNHRKTYIIMRVGILRAEQKQLIAEKKDLIEKLKAARA
jgi:hypothetical protein